MKIAEIAPLYENVPPQFHGGTERVVHYLTEELVRQGHEVALFASGDSQTSAQLVSGCATTACSWLCPGRHVHAHAAIDEKSDRDRNHCFTRQRCGIV